MRYSILPFLYHSCLLAFRPSCIASFLSCILLVLHPSCPASYCTQCTGLQRTGLQCSLSIYIYIEQHSLYIYIWIGLNTHIYLDPPEIIPTIHCINIHIVYIYIQYISYIYTVQYTYIYILGWVNFSEFEITVCGSCKMSKN